MLKPLILAASLIIIFTVVQMSGGGQLLEPEKLRAAIAGFGFMAPLIYMLIYTAAPSLMLPGLPITIAGALLFGPVMGVIYTIIGATAGASVAFIVARYWARGWVEKLIATSRLKRLDEETVRNGWKAVALTRLIPLLPFNLLNFAFGLTSIPFSHYALATFIFMLPGTIAYVTFSSSLFDLLRGKVSLKFVVGSCLLAVIWITTAVVRRYRKSEVD